MTLHGGNLRLLAKLAGRAAGDVLDFSASINPLGPPECVRRVISRNVENLVHYPDPDCVELIAAISRRYNLPADRIVVGNGSTELLHAISRLFGATSACGFAGQTSHRAVIPVPTYTDYAAAAEQAGMAVQHVPSSESGDFAIDWNSLASQLRAADVVFLGQPNNPTGMLFDPRELIAKEENQPQMTQIHTDESKTTSSSNLNLCSSVTSVASPAFVIDEAFADFAAGYLSLAHRDWPNAIVVRSLTKFYAIPGLRLGFAACHASLAAELRRLMPNWSVNALAQAVGAAVLADDDYARRSVQFVAEQRQRLAAELSRLPGVHVYPSEANYLLVRMDRTDLDAHELSRRLLADGIAIRTFTADQHLDGRFFRVAVRTREENERLIGAIRKALGIANAATVTKQARAIMFQGTSSNAGKSILTAAMCRILLQDGLRVAPFKSQNMSLNSFVTADGGEMGRAQVVQAQACRLEPQVRMNPILLKPNSATGSQVIVRGQPVGNMRVGEYIRFKPQAFQAACECYDSLARDFDVIVLEGAGSPGEVNLKSHDIVNMRMAEYANAPVLVVGDIDRGGVFASFVGTMEVLAEWERALVAGWIVNRFRGDASLLGAALDYTLAHTGRPVLGVVPYLDALNIPQEDSVEFKSGMLHRGTGVRGTGVRGTGVPPVGTDHGQVEDSLWRDAHATQTHGQVEDSLWRDGRATITLALIDLPHISNFTDFDAFAAEPDVQVRLARSPDDLRGADAIIIPGSKNTLADLEHLRRSGLAGAIDKCLADGTSQVVGICAGLQMLGQTIGDPHRVESDAGEADGLGLLDVRTVLGREKTLVRTTARHVPSGLAVSGYEIHHGQTNFDGTEATVVTDSGETVGISRADGRVWGTYLHGIFDADEFRRWFIDRLRVARGLPPLGRVSAYDIEAALDRLADVVRKSLRMEEVYRLLGV